MGYDLAVSTPPPPTLITLNADDRARRLVERTLGLSLPTSSAVGSTNDLTAIFVAPYEWLLIAPAHDERELTSRIEQAAEGSHFAAVVVSDALCMIRLTGPQAHEALYQIVALDLHACFDAAGTAVRCGFGKTSAIVHCVSTEPSFDIYVESRLSAYAIKLLEMASGPD